MGALDPGFMDAQRIHCRRLQEGFAIDDPGQFLHVWERSDTALSGHIGLYAMGPRYYAYLDVVRNKQLHSSPPPFLDAIMANFALTFASDSIIFGNWRVGHPKWRGWERWLEQDRSRYITRCNATYFRRPMALEPATLKWDVHCSDGAIRDCEETDAFLVADRLEGDCHKFVDLTVTRHGKGAYVVTCRNFPHGQNLLRTVEMAFVHPLRRGDIGPEAIAELHAVIDAALRERNMDYHGLTLMGRHLAHGTKTLVNYLYSPDSFSYWDPLERTKGEKGR